MLFLKSFLHLLFIYSINITQQQQVHRFYDYKIDSFINVATIADIEITNSWTNKKWHLNPINSNKVKAILKQSSATKGLILKPGHLYMIITFKTTNGIKKDSYYMYNSGIFYDAEKTEQSFSVELKKEIDWDKLK